MLTLVVYIDIQGVNYSYKQFVQYSLGHQWKAKMQWLERMHESEYASHICNTSVQKKYFYYF